MPKFKLVKRSKEEASKPAASGSKRTGAKVEKVKAGRKGEATVGRFTGTTTGLSVTKFQNKTILENTKFKKTDEELAMMWRREFPNAKADYSAATVRSVRGLVNRGKHGNDAPTRPVPEYDDEGNALPFRGEKTAAARAAREERSPEKKSTKKTGKKSKK